MCFRVFVGIGGWCTLLRSVNVRYHIERRTLIVERRKRLSTPLVSRLFSLRTSIRYGLSWTVLYHEGRHGDLYRMITTFEVIGLIDPL